MAGLVSGFTKPSENQPDGISKACHEFKIGNELCDVVFRLSSTDNKNVAWLARWVHFFWSAM